MLLIDYLKTNYKNFEIVSFDIFDTLCIRPYRNPDDLFQHISEIYDIDNFKTIRKFAFESAVKKYCVNGIEEVTLDQIYEFVPEELKHIKEKELDLENEVITCNYELKEAFDFLSKNNKKIIIISDMYLPEYFIKIVLSKCGYSNYQKLYLSSSYKKLKATGSLYNYILSELRNIPPEKILHIGDNPYSDYEKSRSIGFSSFLYTPPIKKISYFLPNFIKQLNNKYEDSISYSLFLGILSIIYSKYKLYESKNKKSESYWKNIGITIGGALFYNFVIFILYFCKSNKITDILLAARDCYYIKKVIEKYNIPINAHYVHITRKVSLAGTLSLEKKFEHSFFQGGNSLNSVLDYFNKRFNTSYSYQENYKDTYKWYKDKQEELNKWSKLVKDDIYNYINRLNYDNPKIIGLVDSSTQFFSTQEIISKVLPDSKIIGIYLFVNKRFENRFKNKGYRFIQQYSQFLNIPLIELIFSSPEAPIEYLNENNIPIYKNTITNSEENERKKRVINIHEGISLFFEEAYRIFKNCNFIFDTDFIIDILDFFVNNPEEQDYKEFSKIKCNYDVNHDIYLPFFPQWEEKYNPKSKDKKLSVSFFIDKIAKAQKYNKTFKKYKDIYRNKSIAIIATGPSLLKLKNIEADIFISCNKAFTLKKEIKFDYLFASSLNSVNDVYENFVKYRDHNCIKFISDADGYLEKIFRKNNINKQIYQYVTADYLNNEIEIQYDIGTLPVSYNKSIGFQALQFALYTNPSNIFLVGFDCTNDSRFSGDIDVNTDFIMYDKEQIAFSLAIKNFAKKYYPETNIISINPVGLKNIF